MQRRRSGLQSAVEYLTTYGWAILLVAIVIVALYSFGFFNTNNDQCTLGSGLSCQNEVMSPNGILSVTVFQTTGDPINVTGIACAEGNSSVKFQSVRWTQNSSTSHTYSVQCYTSSGSPYSSSTGSTFKGSVDVEYQDTYTGYTHTIYGIIEATATPSAPGLTTISSTSTSTSTTTIPLVCYGLTLSPSSSLSANIPETPGCSSGNYISGQQIMLTATPATGYTFNSWSGSFTCTNGQNTCNVIMPANSASETASFVQACYTLTLSASGLGSLSANTANSPGCSSGNYIYDQQLTLTATANSGSGLSSWSGAFTCSNSQTTCSVTMPASSASETAAFSTCYSLTLSASGSGTLAANVAESTGCSYESYISGQQLTLTATAGSGYTFNSWSGSFTCSNSISTCSVTMPTSSASETAAFSQFSPMNILYGTTYDYGSSGYGILFSYDFASNTYTVLHSFAGGSSDGANPEMGNLTIIGNTLYGMTSAGGSSGDGVIFSFNTATNTLAVLHSFAGGSSDGEYPDGALTLVGNTLYGTAEEGGSSDNGVLFSFNTATNILRVIHSFAGGSSDGEYPDGHLTLVGNTLYGTAVEGGSSSDGIIFSYNLASNTYTILHNFAGYPSDGANPDSLTLVGNTLYGMTQDGGSSGENSGTIFSLNTTSNTYALVLSLSDTLTGQTPLGSLILSGNIFYGATQFGGSDGGGTLFTFNPVSNTLTVLYSFSDGSQYVPQDPYASPVIIGTTLYGMTSSGGSSDHGIVYSFSLATNTLAVLHSFAGGSSDGGDPWDPLTVPTSTVSCYALVLSASPSGFGTLSANVTNSQECPSDSYTYTPDQQLTLTATANSGYTFNSWSGSFTCSNSQNTCNVIMPVSLASETASFSTTVTLAFSNGNSIFQGTTDNVIGTTPATGDTIEILSCNGLSCTPSNVLATGTNTVSYNINGLAGGDYVFEAYDANAGVYSVSNAVVVYPPSLVFSSNILVGTTEGTPTYGDTPSTIFSFNTVSNTVSTLYTFTNDNSGEPPNPYGPLILSGTTFYGITEIGGSSDDGTLFSFNTIYSTVTTLHSFGGSSDGENPEGPPTLVGTTLYGMTSSGGSSGDGIIYSYNIISGTYTVLHSFAGGSSDGAESYPVYSSLVASGTTLYGMTNGGGSSGDGVIFAFNTISNTITILHSFAGGSSDGSGAVAGPTLVGTTLYGMTSSGGSSSDGTIFALNTLSDTITIYSLNSLTGFNAQDTLTLSGNTLYGMTGQGGDYDDGTLLSFNILSDTITVLAQLSGAPFGPTTLVGNTLYGVATLGGSSSVGSIFSFNIPSNTYTSRVYSFPGTPYNGYYPSGITPT